MPNSVWVDDLYQGIPALAQMGKLTGESKYFDEATKQVDLFSKRLFDRNRGVCMHGWVEGMDPHPAFYWARANGWAILAIAALLDVLPENHSGQEVRVGAISCILPRSGYLAVGVRALASIDGSK